MEALVYRSYKPSARLVLTDEYPGQPGVPILFYEFDGYPGGRTTFAPTDRLPKTGTTIRDILLGWIENEPIKSGDWGLISPEAVELGIAYLTHHGFTEGERV